MENNVAKIFLGDLFRQEFFEVFCYIWAFLVVACIYTNEQNNLENIAIVKA